MMEKLNYKLLGASCLTAGLLFASFEIRAMTPSLTYKLEGSNLTLTYTGTLYQSSDVVHWSEVGSASSPYKVKVTDKKLFFCTKGESGGADGQNFTIPLSGTVSLDMVWCPAGTFVMGSPSGELGSSNYTQHSVTLSHGFWIGKYEVTQAQYKAVMGLDPSHFDGDNNPVECVAWYNAMDFCVKLTAQEKAAGRLPEGYEYTLPTEAQWEYACRAGTTTALNSGKNLTSTSECPEMDEVGWYANNSDDTTHPVGQKQPNAWGLYDMHGNVWEWCLDGYEKYPNCSVTDPIVFSVADGRVLRGGSWTYDAGSCRSAYREYDYPSSKHKSFGFRVALSFCGNDESEQPSVQKDNFTISLSETVNLDMVWIEPGIFMMGSPENELGRSSGEVQYQVTLTKGYWLGKYEVTQAQYETIMGSNPAEERYGGIGDNYPVYPVSWYRAMGFCEKLTAQEREAGRLPEGYIYTLPTHAQWEYACRAGTTTALNSGKNLSNKNKCPEMDEVGWYANNSGREYHPVGQKKPNNWGIYDMHGNVEEWCLDWHNDYPAFPITEITGTLHGVRGGDRITVADKCRSGCRSMVSDGAAGFRIVLSFCGKEELEDSDNTNVMTIPLSDKVNLDMVWIEPGTFMMGSPKDELGRSSDETQHQVTLTQGYWLGKYEVTQEQYEAIKGSNPSSFRGFNHPVEFVSWDDAMQFCAKLTEIEKAAGRLPEGYEYTLPTEAQWEYACRAGTTTALNSGKNLSDSSKCPEINEVGWYNYNCGWTHSVGQKQPNAWGLYDMHGNVEEWCLDWYEKDYPASSVTDPTGPSTGSNRVVRGGGWNYNAFICRSAYRSYDYPGNSFSLIGFRVALSPVQ